MLNLSLKTTVFCFFCSFLDIPQILHVQYTEHAKFVGYLKSCHNYINATYIVLQYYISGIYLVMATNVY